MTTSDRIGRIFSLDNQALFLSAVVLSIVPLWIPEFLPLVDVPQHAALVASMHGLLSGNEYLGESLEINWFTPYLGGYLALFLASAVLPIVPATKLVVTGRLLKDIGADPRLKWLAIPGSFSFALYWGFMAYLVAVPIALGLLLATIHFERRPSVSRGIGMALFSIALFFCHAVALGFGALLSLSYLVAKNLRSPGRLIRCAIPYTAPLPIIFIWMSGIYETEDSVQGSPIIFAPLGQRLRVLFDSLSGFDGSVFAISLLVAAGILILPFAFGYRLSTRVERWLPLIVGVAVYLSFPYYMQATAYLYQRLGVFLIPLWLMVWDPPKKQNAFFGVAVMLVVGSWFVVNAKRFIEFAGYSESFTPVLESAEPGRRIAGMLFCNGEQGFRYPVYLHFHAWYQAVSSGIADNSFAMTHPGLVRYRNLSAPRVGDVLAWSPAEFDWKRDGGDTYDYYLVCAGGDLSDVLFKDRIESVALVAREDPWWLYRNIERVSN